MSDAAETRDEPEVSVVIPVFNEEANLVELYTRLTAVLDGAASSHEIVFVDDGSRDASVSLIRGFHAEDDRVRLVRLSRNFGHQAALNAGLDQACGQAVIFMDGDLQDPPEVLPQLLDAWHSGAEVAYGVRGRRDAPIIKRVAYASFYRVYRALAEIDVPLDSGDFALLDKQVADAIRSLPEHQRFLRGLRSWVGFEQVGITYDRPDRYAGEAKYNFRSLLRLAIDGLISFSALPLRLASLLGFATALLGVFYIAFALVARVASGSIPDGWTSIVAIVLVLGGVQLLVIGIMGEYLARVYVESKGRPSHIVREVL